MGVEKNHIVSVINANIKQNGNNEITGDIMNDVLNEIVDATLQGYHFMGILKSDSQPPANSPWIYFANNVTYGAYQFGADEFGVLYYDDVPMATPVKKILFSVSNAVADHNEDPTAHQAIRDMIEQADWSENNAVANSYVKNRTHYKRDTNIATYTNETDKAITVSGGYGVFTMYGYNAYPLGWNAAVGRNMSVTIGDTKYEGEIKKAGSSGYCIGNYRLHFPTGVDTGEDYCIYCDSAGFDNLHFMVAEDLAGEYEAGDITIVLSDLEYVPLDARYIPKSVTRADIDDDTLIIDVCRRIDLSSLDSKVRIEIPSGYVAVASAYAIRTLFINTYGGDNSAWGTSAVVQIIAVKASDSSIYYSSPLTIGNESYGQIGLPTTAKEYIEIDVLQTCDGVKPYGVITGQMICHKE